jgi:hypothetical protein
VVVQQADYIGTPLLVLGSLRHYKLAAMSGNLTFRADQIFPEVKNVTESISWQKVLNKA